MKRRRGRAAAAVDLPPELDRRLTAFVGELAGPDDGRRDAALRRLRGALPEARSLAIDRPPLRLGGGDPGCPA